MRPLALLPVLPLLVMAPAAAQMPQDYVIDTAADLVAVCSVDPADEAYVAASNFCEGYGHGAVQYHLIEVRAMPERRMFCTPSPAPTREAVLADFLTWMDQNPQYLSGEALDALFTFLAVSYPCP